MTSLLSIAFLPYLFIFLLTPLAILIAGKALGVLSDKLKYSKLLMIVFVGSLLGGFFRELHPYALVGVFFVVVLWMIKKQLDTGWGKALAMTLSGMIVAGALSYGANYFLAKKLGIQKTNSQMSQGLDFESTFGDVNSLVESGANDEVKIIDIDKTKITSQECLELSLNNTKTYSEKKFDYLIFKQLDQKKDEPTKTGDGYTSSCLISYTIPNNKLYTHFIGNQLKVFTTDPINTNSYAVEPEEINFIDSLNALEILMADQAFLDSLAETGLENPNIDKSDLIFINGIHFNEALNQYVWGVSVVSQITNKIHSQYYLDPNNGDILKRTRREGMVILEYINGKWIDPKSSEKEEDSAKKPSRPKLPTKQ